MVTATTSAAVPYPYYLSIYDDQGQRLTSCNATFNICGTANTGSLSTTIVVSNNATRTFTAYGSQDAPPSSIPVNDVRAISSRLSTAGNGPTSAGETAGGSNPSVPCSARCHGDPVARQNGWQG